MSKITIQLFYKELGLMTVKTWEEKWFSENQVEDYTDQETNKGKILTAENITKEQAEKISAVVKTTIEDYKKTKGEESIYYEVSIS